MKRARGSLWETKRERRREEETREKDGREEERKRAGEGGKKTVYTPCRRRVRIRCWHKRRHACVSKRKGVVDRLAGRLVPLSMHADGLALYWNASRVFSRGGSTSLGRNVDGRGEDGVRGRKKERERQTERGSKRGGRRVARRYRDPRRDSSIRDRRERGGCVGSA